MKVFIAIALGLTIQAVAFAQNPPASRVLLGTQPLRRGTAMVMLQFAFVPETLKELRDYSEVIVEGTVESKMAAREHSTGLETDALVTLNRVVKGDPSLQRIVIGEVGGTLGAYQEVVQNNTLMEAGEHYFFFLLSDKRTDLPVFMGRNRYSVVCAWIGKARVIGGKVTISAASPQSLKDAYDGVTVDQFLNALLAQ